MANLERSEQGGVTVLRLWGSLNEEEVAEVQRPFYEATHRAGAAVVVDLSHVDLVTTPAIAMLVEAAKTLRTTGGKMAVSAPQPRVNDVLRLLHLERLLPVFATVPEGVAGVGGRAEC